MKNNILCQLVEKYLRRKWFGQKLAQNRTWRVAHARDLKGNSHFELINKMALQPLSLNEFLCRLLVPSVSVELAELAIRQKILAHKFQLEILPRLVNHFGGSKTPLKIGIPSKWRKLLSDEGVCIGRWPSEWSWYLFILRTYIRALKNTWRLSMNSMKVAPPPEADYAVLVELSKGAAFSVGDQGKPLKNFSSWYRDSEIRLNTETQIWAHVPGTSFHVESTEVQITPILFPCLPSLKQRLKFAIVTMYRLLLAGISIILGKWQAVFLAEEAVYLEYVRCLTINGIATSYLFNNSEILYRPLWTHKVEAMGSRVLMVFYSTNIMPFRWRDGTRTMIHPLYRLLNWSRYLVWGEEQGEFIRELAGESAVIEPVGVVSFTDSDTTIPPLPHNSVAVFDVSVFRDALFAEKGLLRLYYNAQTLRQFLFGSWEAITAAGKYMVLKRKRNISSDANREYMRVVDELSNRDGVIILDPSINAERLITKVQAVISIPYTSTAVAARLNGVPSIYYDPTFRVQNFGYELQGVTLKYEGADVARWLKEIT